MKKPKYQLTKYLQDECRRLGIDPDWYDNRRQLYQYITSLKSAEAARKRRGAAKKEQWRRSRYKPLEDKSGNSIVPNEKPDRWMWD